MNVIIDVQWHRHLLYPTELKGTISLDGVMFGSLLGYTDETEFYHHGITASLDFWDGILRKIKNEKIYGSFAIPFYSIKDLQENRINIDSDNMHFNMVNIAGFKNNIFIDLYGPAETATEAKSIALKMYT
jgi:hypothetical protein